MGYEKMSENGREMAEVIELMARYDLLKVRAGIIPGFSVPGELTKEIRARFARLGDDVKAAITALRTPGFRTSGTWLIWRDAHIKLNPQDAADLIFLEEVFGGGPQSVSLFVHETCGLFQRPWRMDHQW